jgi:hypothetical protein
VRSCSARSSMRAAWRRRSRRGLGH